MEWWILVAMIIVAILATTWAAARDHDEPPIEPDTPEEGPPDNGNLRAIASVPETTS